MAPTRLTNYPGAQTITQPRAAKAGRVQKPSAMGRPTPRANKQRYGTQLRSSKTIRVTEVGASADEGIQKRGERTAERDVECGEAEEAENGKKIDSAPVMEGKRCEVRHPVWKYESINDSDSKHKSHHTKRDGREEFTATGGADMAEETNTSWNDPQWQERGSAPSREHEGYTSRQGGDNLFDSGGSRQVPAGLIKRASGGGSEDGEDRKSGGSGGDGGDGGDEYLPPILFDGQALNRDTLPSVSELGLPREEQTEEVHRVFATALLNMCTIDQRNNLARKIAGSDCLRVVVFPGKETAYFQTKMKEWNSELSSFIIRVPQRFVIIEGELAQSGIHITPEGIARSRLKLAGELGNSPV